jgi:hypothetical protein
VEEREQTGVSHGSNREKGSPTISIRLFVLWPPQFGSIFGSSRTKPSFWILKALPPRSPDQVLLRELRSMEALGEIKRK